MDLSNAIAVVTGASAGLGAACARILTAKGSVVYGIGRNVERLNALRDELGEKFLPVALDITDETAVAQWVKATFSRAHAPNILLNNAGAGFFAAVETLALDDWNRMIATNLTGMFCITKHLVPFMRDAGRGHVINVGSVLGKVSRPEATAYSASKFGVQGFSAALSAELRPAGIKVTCFNPGSIATGFFRQSGIAPHKNMLQPGDLAAMIACVLETPDNFLVDEMTVRPLDPRQPGKGDTARESKSGVT